MIQQLFSIARNTFTQGIRQPIFMIIILIGFFCLIINLSISSNTMRDDNVFMVSNGMSTIYVFAVALSAFIATGVLTAEIENKTVLTVVSKPISKSLFILGKFLGILAAEAVAFWLLSLALLFCIRHGVMQTVSTPFDMPVIIFVGLAVGISLIIAMAANYFYHWVFTSTFIYSLLITGSLAFFLTLFVSKKWEFQSITTDFEAQTFYAIMMIFQSIIIITAFAIMLSTRLKQVTTIICCFIYLALGSVINNTAALFGADSFLTHTLLSPFARLNFFWPGDAIVQDIHLNFGYVLQISLYALTFTGALLATSIGLFQTKDVG